MPYFFSIEEIIKNIKLKLGQNKETIVKKVKEKFKKYVGKNTGLKSIFMRRYNLKFKWQYAQWRFSKFNS